MRQVKLMRWKWLDTLFVLRTIAYLTTATSDTAVNRDCILVVLITAPPDLVFRNRIYITGLQTAVLRIMPILGHTRIGVAKIRFHASF